MDDLERIHKMTQAVLEVMIERGYVLTRETPKGRMYCLDRRPPEAEVDDIEREARRRAFPN